jgi:hypothetical protein
MLYPKILHKMKYKLLPPLSVAEATSLPWNGEDVVNGD